MKIEAICAARGLHREYLIRVSHAEAIALGASSFEAGEHLTVTHAIERIEAGLTQLRSASRAMRETPGVTRD